jgi:putative SOS response-associated peptidase YedK
MCGRFILIQDAVTLKNRFRVAIPEGTIPVRSYNISPGQKTAVITGESPGVLQLYRFGLTAVKNGEEPLLANVPSEVANNASNDSEYQAAMGIFSDPHFSMMIRSRRCLIPADAYIEYSTGVKFSRPFLIYLRNKIRPFAFAGIWDEQIEPETNKLVGAFAILTTGPNQLVARLPHDRMPVILRREDEERWLSSGISDDELISLMQPFPPELMNGFPIAPTINNPHANDPGLIHPTGPRIFSEA